MMSSLSIILSHVNQSCVADEHYRTLAHVFLEEEKKNPGT
uniref:Uncharacterized protein n=1 Tax=Arundo donax TaxID=35708 RepID=A0A0A9ATZ5_ARUDO